MILTLERYNLLDNEDAKLLLREQNGEITEEERCLRSDQILDRILSYENVHNFTSFDEFEKGFANSMIKEYGRQKINLPPTWINWVRGQAYHEREHAQAIEGYGLIPTYCFMYDPTQAAPGFWQPFNFVRSIDIFRKGWDDYTKFKYHIQTTSAPQILSVGDKTLLRALELRVTLDLKLTVQQKKELLRLAAVGRVK